MSEEQSLSFLASSPPLLPPPAPPPLLTPSSKECVLGKKDKCSIQIVEKPVDCLSAKEQARKAFKNLCLQGLLANDGEVKDIMLSCYNPVKPVLQNGPVCGLVALSMASQVTNENCASPDEIFSEALKQGFSKQGEIFSVSFMEKLSNHFLDCPVEKLNLKNDPLSQKDDEIEIVSHLLQQSILLVPYDADKNHSPCQRKGHKAHWAVITGIVLTFQSLQNCPKCIKTVCQRDSEFPSLFLWPVNPSLDLCKDLASFAVASPPQTEETIPDPSNIIYVYGHQGKSKHAGLWNLHELIQSNAQLDEEGPERSSEDYVIPDEGVAHGLKSQILVVKRLIK